MVQSDFVVDLSYGDCGKGKVTHALLQKDKYSHCIRFAGGANAGHTIYHHGQKLITHLIPSGVFWKVPSLIGPGCVVNVKGFFEELEYLTKAGVDCSQVKIAHQAHIVTEEHLTEDRSDTKIGTTKRGIGPAYRAKYGRTGVRAEQVSELQEFVTDFHYEVFTHGTTLLFEGAQGFQLDIDHGDYPYVTSSHCTVAGALLNGVPPQSVRKVFGVAKVYETYVGAKRFQPEGEVFNQLRELGQEYGATTGRPRQCNWLDLNELTKAIKINGVTDLILNKADILDQVGVWNLRRGDQVINFASASEFQNYITEEIKGLVKSIKFSYSPEHI